MKNQTNAIIKITLATVFLFSLNAFADNTAAMPNHPPHACQQIEQACKNAGFMKGDWKKGDGLWRDCVDPIVQGQTNAPGISKSLPSVDPSIVSDCKAKHPKFGMGKVGTPAPKAK